MNSNRIASVVLLAVLTWTFGFAPAAVAAADAVAERNDVPTDLPSILTLEPASQVAAPIYAQVDVPKVGSDRWWTAFSLVAWLPTFDGTLSVGDREGDASDNVTESFDLFDTYVDWGIDLHVELGHGRLGFLFDALYVDIHSDRETGDGDTFRVVTDGFVGEVAVFYTVIGEPIGVRMRRSLRVDALGGARVGVLGLGIESDTLDDIRQHETKVDPFVGARADLGLTDWLSLRARGDVGGFGIADITSDFVWSANLSAAVHLGERFDIELGYHWLDYDFEGDDDDDITYNASIAGPYLAFTIWL